jgi:hypothetical protein
MLPGTAFLNSGGMQRYHLDRALKFFLLKSSLDESTGEVGRMVADSPALQTVAARSGADIVGLGSTFFWFYVELLYDRAKQEEPFPTGHFHLFMTQLFDCFYPLLQDADSVVLTGATPDIVLPCLGIRVRTGGRDFRMTRLSSRRIGIAGEGLDLTIELDAPGEYGLPVIALSPTARLLFGIDSLVEDAMANQSIADLSGEEGREFAALLVQALDLIRVADRDVARQIDAIIKWYFPIKTHDKRQVHNSFSVASLHGAIFLSESYSFLPLAEALVHEFYHNELWMAMMVDKHLRNESAETLYSPWRKDARPLLGLYHGIYVFTGLLEFFTAGAREPALREHHSHFHARRCSIFHQLRTALAQVRSEDLEPAGRELIGSLSAIVGRHGEELGAMAVAVPDWQRTHWLEWSARYPDLSRLATPPIGVERFEVLSTGGSS